MKIGIDIDEIIVEFVRGYLQLYNQKYNKTLSLDEVFSYNLFEPLKISREASIELADEYYDSEGFDNILFVDGAEEGIKKLNKDYELIFVTARPSHVKKKTEIFIKNLFPDLDSKIFYSKNIWEEGLFKSEICKTHQCDVLIEDDLKHALECAENGIKIILLDKPWNQNVEHENIIRAKNWDEILEKINELNTGLVEDKQNEIIEEIRKFVEEECKKPEAKYDYELFLYHIVPVLRYVKKLGEKRGADLEILELAALLHDVGSVIYGRENHHITSCEIAEKNLRELNYPEERIEKIKHCILSHRGSLNIKKESIEAEILAEADSMTHFDTIPGLFRACYCFEEKKSQREACKSVLNKLINSYNKLSLEARKIIKPKFEAAMLLFCENEQ